jgi:hypothetical protein
MSSESVRVSLEKLLRSPGAGLKVSLSQALEEIRVFGIGELLDAYPRFMADLLDKLKPDAVMLFGQIPGAADQLTGLLWDGVTLRAGRSKEMGSLLEKADRDFRCNIEASDSPFRSHFILEHGRIRGAPGLLHFKDEDFRFMGPTEVLMELLTGDLPLGFGNLRLQTAGHPGWLRRIGPVMREIGRLIKGGPTSTEIDRA